MSESMRARWQALAQHFRGRRPDPQHYPPHSPYTSLAGGWISALVQMSSFVTMTREGMGSAGTSSKGASPPLTFTCPCDSQPPWPCRLLNPHSRTPHFLGPRLTLAQFSDQQLQCYSLEPCLAFLSPPPSHSLSSPTSPFSPLHSPSD